MDMYSWRFPKLDDGQEQGINDSGVATFKGSELYDNLAREICQNSLDAKAPDQTTVIVEFNSISLPKKDHSALVGLDEVIKNCEEFWKKKTEPKFEAFIKEAKAKLSHDNIEFLVISDYNTKGLSGSRAGITERSVWRALTHSNGVTQRRKEAVVHTVSGRTHLLLVLLLELYFIIHMHKMTVFVHSKELRDL